MEKKLSQSHAASSCKTLMSNTPCHTTPLCDIFHLITDSVNIYWAPTVCHVLVSAKPGATYMSKTGPWPAKGPHPASCWPPGILDEGEEKKESQNS